METAGVGAVLKVMAEQGILGLGWILFLITLLYLKIERQRYADLVLKIIEYFTKVNMIVGKIHNAEPVSPAIFRTEVEDREVKSRP